MMRSFILVLLVLFSIGKPAHAELGPISFRDLVQSDNIVCARVEKIHRDKGHWTKNNKGKSELCYRDLVAQAVVLKVIKGRKFFVGQQIYIAAYSTWMCDATQIASGEESMFFLNKTDQRPELGMMNPMVGYSGEISKILQGKPLYFIAASGRGHVSLSIKAGQIGIAVSRSKRGIHLGAPLGTPAGLPITWGSQVFKGPDGNFYRSGVIPIDAMEKLLNQLMAEQSAKKVAREKG